MKILFLINDPPLYAVSEWEEIKKYQKEGYYLTPTQETHSLVKALEQNTEFEKEIIKARRNIGIPEEGIDWKEYRDSYNPTNAKKLNEKERKNRLDLFMKVVKEMMRIRGVLDLDYFVTNQLRHLIYGNFVYPEYPYIAYGYTPVSEGNELGEYLDDVFIRVHSQVSKNELLAYIENRWEDIGNLIHNLPPKPDYYISERDRRIAILRDKDKLSFSEITNRIVEEFKIDDSEGKVNEDAVKTAYRRAKLKILSLTKRRERNR